jgi:hypothetical protein
VDSCLSYSIKGEIILRHTNKLADMFNWLGEVFEKFNPAAFRFLAAVLPYMTPIPVAWLTSHSASKFLGFTSNVSWVFVLCLEGIGLWFTSLLVDAVVEWIKTKNRKSFWMVLLFGLAVGAYVTILVNLNVTIENAVNQNVPAYSRVITLLCFLPLITGIGDGYYKLRLEQQTKEQTANEINRQQQDKIRQEGNDLKLKKAALKHGFNPFAPQPTVTLNQDVPQVKEERERRASDYKEKIWKLLDEQYDKGRVLKVVEITEHFHLPYDKAKGFVSTQRTLWASSRGVDLGKKGSTS